MVRTGWSGYYLQQEDEWPIARTEYRKLHLAIANEDYHEPNGMVSFALPQAGKVSYPAEVAPGTPPNIPTGPAFVTEPLEEDVVLIGYPKLHLFASSTSTDMRVNVTLRAMDDAGNLVNFQIEPDPNCAMTAGALKLSHRKEDADMTRDYRPFHTHLEKDCQQLEPGEIVEANVEMLLTTACVRKGWRLMLTIQPDSMFLFDPFDDYSAGATNTIYAGGEYDSYLQIPVIPAK